MTNLIVSRHQGLVEWLATRRGVYGEVVEHATPETVTGRVVYGVLPFHLAVLAKRVHTIDLPGLRLEQRGKDLTPAEMDAAGATIVTYQVFKLAAYSEG